jgi:HlyD family secretion protein
MPEINEHEIRSAELQEVMSEIPGSFIKWGLLLMSGIILAILGISWFISSPDVVTAPITVTTYNPPVSLVARSSGKIERFFVNNSEEVGVDVPIALIGNLAHWDDIKRIEIFLNSLSDSIKWETVIQEINPPAGLILGEIQDPWWRFVSLSRKFNEYLKQAYLPAKLDLIDKQIKRQEEYTQELKNQKLLSEEDLNLTYNSYQRDSNLFHRTNYSISINEFEQSRQALLEKQISFSVLRSSIKNNESSILKMKETKLDLLVQYEKEVNQFISDINESLQLIEVSMGKWKEKYLIQTPVSGKITFTSFWNENQVISPGEIIATIIPDNPKQIIIRANVPVTGSGKVQTGQEVNIKLSGYPYMQYGILKGRIVSLSMVPVQDAYIADIELANGMRTSYGIELGFVNGMTGTAEIITENRRLINSFIKPLQSILKN